MSASTKWTSALHAAVDKVNDKMFKIDDAETIVNIVKPELSKMIKKDDSESILKIVKPELSNVIKKDDTETIVNIVKPELSNMIKKDDSQSILKIVKLELENMIKKDSLNSSSTHEIAPLSNLTATKGYIDIGNRRLVKTANAIDKYDVVNKGQLDDALTNYGHYSFLQFVGKIIFIKEVHGQKAVTFLDFSFDGERFLRLPMNILIFNFKNKKEKVNTDANLGGYNSNRPYLLSTPIFFYMLVKFSV
ncbi:hypothetical protein BDFB_014343 [Asbolus verrucosus]|uniref:Uncharacterized protein n=1 Tax=Asbolus verrucosus TaxID=1661398 RepID=A0A482WDG9_ASBVE|nr:hypothetical protein BDFB_014343 [Asbolus verrucosus]